MVSISTEHVNISILLLDEATMLTVASVLDPLRAANRLAQRRIFQWQLYSPQGLPIRLVGNFQMQCDGAFAQARPGEILIVIASFHQDIHANTALVSEIRRLRNRFQIIIGVEAGTWLLARAGIADGHRVTTHWEDHEALATRWPETTVVPDRFVIDGRVWTCGGASPALDMMLELIARTAGKPLALETASVFIYDQTHSSTDSQPALSLGRIVGREPRIGTAVRLMEKNIDSPLPIPAIARRTGISVKMLEILFVRYLDMTPARYYQRLRLLAARKLLLDTGLSVHEIAVRCGFNSQSAFSRAFHKAFEETASSIRTRGF